MKKKLHVRRNMWGQMILPELAYQAFKHAKIDGYYADNFTWRMRCQQHRKKVRKMKIARYSRKGMRKHIKRAR